jgi:LmbE family N-acetylglucosaminyl deacetylase
MLIKGSTLDITMNKMRMLIIAPHPDDEWIGCGSSILTNIGNNIPVQVLIITRMPYSENRINISKQLSRQYGYKLKILGEPEKQINIRRLRKFLTNNIYPNDIIYIPSNDLHPDHRLIRHISLETIKNNKIYEYAVYNNSLNPIIRLKNKLFYFITGRAASSFRYGRTEAIVKYNVAEKNKNIRKFLETMRNGDVLRIVKHIKS